MNCLNWILCDPFGATAQLAKLFQSVSLAVFAQIASRQRSFTARGACHGLHRACRAMTDLETSVLNTLCRCKQGGIQCKRLWQLKYAFVSELWSLIWHVACD